MTEDDLRHPEIDRILQHAAMVMCMPVTVMRQAVLDVIEFENRTAKIATMFPQPTVTLAMLARTHVYDLIDGKATSFKNYFGIDAGGVKTPPLPDSLEEWLSLMRSGVIRGLLDYHCPERLGNFLSLAAKCVLCMEAHGYVPRRNGCEIVHGNRSQIYCAVDAEVQFIRPRSIEGYVLLVDHLMREAIDNWASSTNQACTLVTLRRLAAVCVRCLQEHAG